ncbi:accessory factor associated with RNA polymerase II [Coemansia sp. RSA 1722]|nr:accessory factor associated with RNA polymerase II [Coemansia sp. RSA 485]KAJ2598761.1 accessory factor associated with RNA polymerase II [Coemansia sp. RSA 1721]KAJ2603006.1 accessory factor associated with RNA polymerase II [Coemansia sp. RSA 1722]
MASNPALGQTSDPLELLRQYTTQKKPVELLDNDGNLTTNLLQATTVRFGEDASFPRDTPTSYSRSNSDSDQYTLSALLHFLDHRDQSFYEYMKTTNTMGLQTVSFGDRVTLLDYLTGKSTSTGEEKQQKQLEQQQQMAVDTAVDSSRRANKARTDLVGDSGRTANDGTRDILRRERVLINTSSVVSSSKSFAKVPDLIKEIFPPKHGAKGADGKPMAPAAGALANGALAGNGVARKRVSQRKRANPIIVVPAATTAMINMYNIEELLQKHQFVDSRMIMETGGPKPREVFIDHQVTRSSQRIRVRVVDSVQDFTEADWNSLICVFTQGAAWQFKNWVWKSPEEVFQNTMGFYPKYNDERPKDSIKSWGVEVINIERTKRHMDKAAVVGLWSSIEQYLASKKPDFLN